MEVIFLDGARLTSREAAHAYLAQALHFPGYYGKNLDALHDCLTELPKDTRLAVTGVARLGGTYGEQVLEVLRDAADERGFVLIELMGS